VNRSIIDEGELINQFTEGVPIKNSKPSMTNVVSALTARTQFGQIIKRATQKNERFLVGHRGEPSVVILSMRDYINTFAPAPKELRAMQETAKRTGSNSLTPGQINRVVATVRKKQGLSETKRRS
jgi:prevent-host-death family protein